MMIKTKSKIKHLNIVHENYFFNYQILDILELPLSCCHFH